MEGDLRATGQDEGVIAQGVIAVILLVFATLLD
jgi:hypothetical protein